MKEKVTRHLNSQEDNTCKEWRMLLSSTIMALLEMLGDGKWHAITELLQQSGIADYKIQEIVAFLSSFDFAVFDEANEKVKISSDFQELLRLK